MFQYSRSSHDSKRLYLSSITGIGKQEQELMANLHMMCYVCMHLNATAFKYFFLLKSKRPSIYNNVVSSILISVIYFQRYNVL